MTDQPGGTALRELLVALPERVPVHTIDTVWIFPPLHIADRETGLAVLALLPEDGRRDSRRVLTLRYEIRGTGKSATRSDSLTEQGTAPADSVQRVIDGVLRRLGEEAAEPAVHDVHGDEERWAELLRSVGPSEG